MGVFSPGAFVAGAAVRGYQQGAAQKQASTDEEHENMLAGYNESASNLKQRMAQVGPNSPEYAGLQTQLNQVVADTTALFHPNRPGGLERLGKLVWNKVHGAPPDQAPRVAETPVAGAESTTLPGMGGAVNLPGSAGPVVGQLGTGNVAGTATPAASLQGAAPNLTTPALPASQVASDTAPNTPIVPPRNAAEARQRYTEDLAAGAAAAHPQNPLMLLRQNVSQALPHLSPQDLDKVTEIAAGLQAKPIAQRQLHPNVLNFKHPDGKVASHDVNDPDDQPPEGSVRMSAQSAPHQSTSQFETYVRSWFPDGGTPQQREWLMVRKKRLESPGTSSSREGVYYDTNGDPHIVRLSSSSQKEFYGPDGPPPPNADGSRPQLPPVNAGANSGTTTSAPATAAGAATPKTAGEARRQASTVRNGTAAPGADSRLAGIHKNTPAQTEADKKVGEFKLLSTLADESAQHPTAVNQRNLVLSLIRASAGRVNMQEYNSYVKGQGLANTVEQWANNTTTGMLPDEIFAGIVSLTRDFLKASKASQQEAYKGSNVKGKNGSDEAPAAPPANAAPLEEGPPANVVSAAQEGQYFHGPGGVSYRKINGKAVKVDKNGNPVDGKR